MVKWSMALIFLLSQDRIHKIFIISSNRLMRIVEDKQTEKNLGTYIIQKLITRWIKIIPI